MYVEDWPQYDDLYRKRYETEISPSDIWKSRQNYPEIIVDDIIKLITPVNEPGNEGVERYLRDKIYAILLNRGVNKWFAVRRYLIRYKKFISDEIYNIRERKKEYKRILHEPRDIDEYIEAFVMLEIIKEREQTLSTVRAHLKTLCMFPRYVVFREREPAYFNFTGLTKKWAYRCKEFIMEMTTRRFRK